MSKPSKRKWIELDILTEQGTEALKQGKEVGLKEGQVLKFDYEGSQTYVKLMRLDKRTGKVWAKETRLYDRDEFEIVDNLDETGDNKAQ